jgi:hypothetical protein
MGNRRFLEFFAKIELDTGTGGNPLDFTLYSSAHAAPLAFDRASRAWVLDYASIPESEDTVRINVSANDDTWPKSRPGSDVFAQLTFKITAFVLRLDGRRHLLRTTAVKVAPWFLPNSARTTVSARNTVKGSYFIRWNAAEYRRANSLVALRRCVVEQSVNDFYRKLLPAELPAWPGDLPLPSRFLLSACKLTDFFGMRSEGTMFQSKTMRKQQLNSLAANAGRLLGLNCASFDRWTWEYPPGSAAHTGSLNAATVNTVADTHSMPFRVQYCSTNMQEHLGFALSTGMGIASSALMALWNHAHALPGRSDTPIEAQREIISHDIHAGGKPSGEYSQPWSRLRLLVLGEETNFDVNTSLHLFITANQIAALTPGSIAHTCRKTLDQPGILKQPLKPGWSRGQDITLEYHAEFIAYLRSVSAEPSDWGVSDFDALGPIFVEKTLADASISPWEQLARDGDPCALTLGRGPCAIKRKLYLHSILFIHDQVAKSSGLLARRATEAVRELVPGADPRFYIGFATNTFYGLAFRGDGLIFRDSFGEARQNAALVADGLNPITPWMEDNNQNGYQLPDLIGHAQLLRSVAMMSLPVGDLWPAQPGPGAIGEHSLYLNAATYRPDETDDLLYRGLVHIGAGAKAFDIFGGFGPDLRVVTADGESAAVELNVWAPGPRPQHVRALTQMLRTVEDVLYPARPQRSPIAVLITRCSEVWDTTSDYSSYMIERIQLATPLAHAGHPLDYLEETDLLQGALAARNYLVLYLVDPNLPAAAVPIVRDWVNAGGTLVALPGAAVEDEYGYPAGPELDALLGVAQRGKLSARRDYLNARLPNQDRRGLKPRDLGWSKGISEPLGIRVDASALLFPGTSGIYPVAAPHYAQDDGTPLYTFHPLPDGDTETLATWVALGADGAVTSEFTFGDEQTPLPALTRRACGQGAAICYGIMPGAMYKGAAAYDITSTISRSYDWNPDLRLFSIAPLLLMPKGALSPMASAKIVNDNPAAAPGVLTTHGAASVHHLQSDQGVALVVINWSRIPSLTPSSSFRALVSYLLPEPGVEPVNVKTASGKAVNVSIGAGQVVFEMELFSADIITFQLRRSVPLPPDDAIPSLPPLGYIVCDIGKDMLSAVSTNNDPIAHPGLTIRDAEAHVKFLVS